MKNCFSQLKEVISKFFGNRNWLFWVFLVAALAIGGIYVANTCAQDLLHDSKKIEHLKPNTPFLVTPNTTEVENETENSAVAEYQSFLSILSLLISVVVAWVAYKQFPKIANQAEAEFINHIDERWCSKEITTVREELWIEYRKAKNNNYGDDDLAKQEVQNYILKLDDKARQYPSQRNMETLFRHLNFLELLGIIYILREKEFIDDPFLTSVFGNRLKQYLEFYEKYFEHHKSSTINAKKLLLLMQKLEKKT